jgi:hypothetical protein
MEEKKVKLMGPNENFVPKFLKHGGDVKVGGEMKTKLESVNHDDMNGEKKHPDTNPGADEQSRTVHKEEPAEKGARPGMEQPGENMITISKQEKLNRQPRAFKYSREGRAVDNGSNGNGESY